jgi:hypothetical protein
MSRSEIQPTYPLGLSGLAKLRSVVKCENHNFFPGGGANVLMQANDVCAGSFVNHFHQNRPRLFDQLGSDLLEQVSPFFRRERLDKMLLRVRQDAAKADQYKIAN